MLVTQKKVGAYISVIIIFLVQGCGVGEESLSTPSRPNSPIIITVNEQTDDVFADSIYSGASHIVLKNIPNGLIGGVDKIVIDQEKIFVLDRYKAKLLFVFDLNGKFLYKIGTKGGGPGEFVTLEDFEISDNQILTLDSGNGRLSLFDLEGNYIKGGPKLHKLGIIPDMVFPFNNSILSYSQASCTNKGCYSLTVTDENNEIIYKDIPNAHLRDFTVDFGKSGFKHSDKIYLSQIFNDTIYIMSKDLQVTTPYVIDYGKSKPDREEIIDIINDTNRGLSFLLSQSFNLGTVKIFANDHQIWLQYLKNRSLMNLVVNIKNHSSQVFNRVASDPSRQISYGNPVGSTSDQWIFYNQNEALINLKTQLSQNGLNPPELYDNITSETNGIISIVGLNEFNQP